ncbi:MAG TPA: ABC transporter permease, partial [Firmicutes bacterium]|nr:ABC transporter permease [Bacillota bacterium]
LEAGKAELATQSQALVNGENELKAGLQEIQTQKAALATQKEVLETEKANTLAKFKQAEQDLETGKVELEKAERSYSEGKAEAEEKFAEAEAEIKEAESKINDISEAEWYILDREKHYSYVDFKNAAESIEAISKVFPVFFFMVAALVCLTTMTRMVDEQRMTIGTLKALGYSKVKIASKFLIYAGLASILGSVIGTIIGFNVFPRVVLDAYAMMYVLPDGIIVLSWPLVLLATLIAVGVTTLSAYFAVNTEITEAPSVLMRPKAPKEGKRILLERIPFIWNHLSFTGKVTVRNIFRYKKRFLMTVFGIAGCTALLLTGFGIKDSIRTIIDRQFGTIYHYDLSISLDKKITDAQKEELITKLSDDERVYDTLFIKSESGKLESDETTKDVSLVIPQNIEQLDEFVTLQTRSNENPIALPEDGIVITEKVATQLNAKVGSEMTLENVDGKRVTAKVAGIAENYTFHYVYISPNYYQQLFGELPVFDSLLTMINDYEIEMEETFTKDYMNVEGISGLSWNSTVRQSFDDTISSLNYVVLLMIVSAGALAFVVLYNLTNVNISERMREIATIKVLGFYDKEVSAYIYRENIILTIIGTGVGLILGIMLHRYIMLTVEMDMMMFGRNIAAISFVYASALTIFFSILVNFAMYYKLKNVAMVESLKSVD